MIQLEQQLHGYRQGHQLLSASARLPKTDQDLVDRLSDVAGPLRPSETFKSYLTFYPLPSGSSFILARTWQDCEAPRAGCVRTRSLVVPMGAWVDGIDLVGLAMALSVAGPVAPAEAMDAEGRRTAFPRVDAAEGVDVVEAMFLEERRPVAVFEASDPEAMALRIIAAIWPSFRRTIAVSTFALSPRTISGRSFDLVFAPNDARPRFTSAWGGRRIDARKAAGGRHRWSAGIVRRVFEADEPSLLRGEEADELDPSAIASEADLRISLLWSELHGKLANSPNAALGLLDIANSRTPRNVSAIGRLEPALARAAEQAAGSLTPPEAWSFLLALNDKLGGVPLKTAVARSLSDTAAGLARRSPADAIAIVDMLASRPGRVPLVRAVAAVLGEVLDAELAAAVAGLEPERLMELLLLSPVFAEASLPRFPAFSERLAEAFAHASGGAMAAAKKRLLPLLVEDCQAAAARILIDALNEDELLAEARHLAAANAFAATSLHASLVQRARKIGVVAGLRDAVAERASGKHADDMLVELLAPTPDDIQWLLGTSFLDDDRRLGIARSVLTTADNVLFRKAISSINLDALLRLLMREPHGSLPLVERALKTGLVETRTMVETTLRLLDFSGAERAPSLAWRALQAALQLTAVGARDGVLDKLLATAGGLVDGKVAFQLSLERATPAGVAGENLAAFDRAPAPVRRRLLSSIEHMAKAIVARGRLDLPDRATVSAANLLGDSAAIDHEANVRASSTLLPLLLRSPQAPTSRLIAAAFPPVYRELKRSDDTPDLRKFFGLVEWDRCKAARQELVDGLGKSDWRPVDIALAAARAGDPHRILRKIAKHKHGARLLTSIEKDLPTMPNPWRNQVAQAISQSRTTSVGDVFKS